MEIVILIQFAVIILLIKLLLSKNKKIKEAVSLISSDNNETVSITYSWKLDSARKSKLKGHLTLRFSPEEINEQRMNNPFATFNNVNNLDTTTNLRKSTFASLTRHSTTDMETATVNRSSQPRYSI